MAATTPLAPLPPYAAPPDTQGVTERAEQLVREAFAAASAPEPHLVGFTPPPPDDPPPHQGRKRKITDAEPGHAPTIVELTTPLGQ